jgi:IS30 family transposase
MYGWTPNLTMEEINHIRYSLNRCSIEELADELGRAKRTIESKVNEIRESERIRKICNFPKLDMF